MCHKLGSRSAHIIMGSRLPTLCRFFCEPPNAKKNSREFSLEKKSLCPVNILLLYRELRLFLKPFFHGPSIFMDCNKKSRQTTNGLAASIGKEMSYFFLFFSSAILSICSLRFVPLSLSTPFLHSGQYLTVRAWL